MKIITTMVEDNLFESTINSGNRVSIDMRKETDKQGQSPVELLQTAVAACSGVDVVALLKKKKKQIIAFSVETESVRNETHPRWLTAIHCKYVVTSPDIETEEVDEVARLALEKYCAVASSLKSKVTYAVEVLR